MNTFATCFDFEDSETNKQANLTPDKSPEEKAAEEIGYSLGATKICVSGITGRTTQRKLRVKQRNKTFCKVVKGKGDEGNLINESDDFVFIFHCDYNSRDFDGSEWFPKRDQRRMRKYEDDIHRRLRDCDCVDTNLYRNLLALAEKERKIVGDVVRQYFG